MHSDVYVRYGVWVLMPTLFVQVTVDKPEITYAFVCAVSNSVTEPLVLRGYQEELMQKAVHGNNCLIIAPTGSGKTLVAVAIAQARNTVILVCYCIWPLYYPGPGFGFSTHAVLYKAMVTVVGYE